MTIIEICSSSHHRIRSPLVHALAESIPIPLYADSFLYVDHTATEWASWCCQASSAAHANGDHKESIICTEIVFKFRGLGMWHHYRKLRMAHAQCKARLSCSIVDLYHIYKIDMNTALNTIYKLSHSLAIKDHSWGIRKKNGSENVLGIGYYVDQQTMGC